MGELEHNKIELWAPIESHVDELMKFTGQDRNKIMETAKNILDQARDDLIKELQNAS